MATTPAMSLGSRAVAPGARRGRRDARNVRIGYGPVRAETSPRDGARARVVRGRAAARSPARSVMTRAVVNSAVMNLPGMGADGQTWDPLGLGRRAIGWETGDDARDADDAVAESGSIMSLSRGRAVNALSGSSNKGDEDFFGNFMGGNLPGKIGTILALLVVSRVGTYIPISGVDRAAFAESLAGGGGVLGYVDTLTGGSISKLGIFSLGIVPYINSSIIFQVRRAALFCHRSFSSSRLSAVRRFRTRRVPGVARFSRGAFAFAAMNRPFRSRSIEVRRVRTRRAMKRTRKLSRERANARTRTPPRASVRSFRRSRGEALETRAKTSLRAARFTV
jgi:hypothetical protein